MMDSVYFKDIFKVAGFIDDSLSSDGLKEHMLNLHENLEINLYERFTKTTCVDIIVDLWRSNNDWFICLIATFIDGETLIRETHMLTFQKIKGNHDYKNLATIIKKCLEKFNLILKLKSIILDTNMDRVILAQELYSQIRNDLETWGHDKLKSFLRFNGGISVLHRNSHFIHDIAMKFIHKFKIYGNQKPKDDDSDILKLSTLDKFLGEKISTKQNTETEDITSFNTSIVFAKARTLIKTINSSSKLKSLLQKEFEDYNTSLKNQPNFDESKLVTPVELKLDTRSQWDTLLVMIESLLKVHKPLLSFIDRYLISYPDIDADDSRKSPKLNLRDFILMETILNVLTPLCDLMAEMRLRNHEIGFSLPIFIKLRYHLGILSDQNCQENLGTLEESINPIISKTANESLIILEDYIKRCQKNDSFLLAGALDLENVFQDYLESFWEISGEVTEIVRPIYNSKVKRLEDISKVLVEEGFKEEIICKNLEVLNMPYHQLKDEDFELRGFSRGNFYGDFESPDEILDADNLKLNIGNEVENFFNIKTNLSRDKSLRNQSQFLIYQTVKNSSNKDSLNIWRNIFKKSENLGIHTPQTHLKKLIVKHKTILSSIKIDRQFYTNNIIKLKNVDIENDLFETLIILKSNLKMDGVYSFKNDDEEMEESSIKTKLNSLKSISTSQFLEKYGEFHPLILEAETRKFEKI